MQEALHKYDQDKGPEEVTAFVRLCLYLEKEENEPLIGKIADNLIQLHNDEESMKKIFISFGGKVGATLEEKIERPVKNQKGEITHQEEVILTLTY